MMISDNIEALTGFDGPRDDFDDGTCGVLIRSTDTGVYKELKVASFLNQSIISIIKTYEKSNLLFFIVATHFEFM